MKKKMSEKEKKIIIDFVNSDNFMLLNDYCTKSYEITIKELQHRINKAIEYNQKIYDTSIENERLMAKINLDILRGKK